MLSKRLGSKHIVPRLVILRRNAQVVEDPSKHFNLIISIRLSLLLVVNLLSQVFFDALIGLLAAAVRDGSGILHEELTHPFIEPKGAGVGLAHVGLGPDASFVKFYVAAESVVHGAPEALQAAENQVVLFKARS